MAGLPPANDSGALRRTSTRALLRVGVALALISLATAAAGQEPEAAAPAAIPAEAEPAKPALIPAAQVAERASVVQSVVQEKLPHAESEASVEGIEASLPELRAKINDGFTATVEQLAERPSVPFIENVRSEWQARADSLATSRRTLAGRAEGLEKDLTELAKLREPWRLTREQVREESLPPAVVQRIDETLAAIDQALDALKKRQAALLTVQEAVTKLELKVSEVLEAVKTAQGERRKQLLAYDSPPLWAAHTTKRPIDGLVEQLQVSWAENRAAAASFGKARQGAIAFQLVLFLAFTAGTFSLRGLARRRALEDAAFEPTARILQRPVSAAIIGAIIAWPLMNPQAPFVVGSLLGLFLIAPVLRVLTPVLALGLRRGLYLVAAWYVAAWVREFLVPDPIAARLLLLAESIGIGLILAWVLRPARLDQLTQVGGWVRAIGFSLRLSVVLLAAAVIANVLGNVSLANVLAGGILNAALVGFVLYASFQILEGLYTVLLHTQRARALRMVRTHEWLLRRRGVAFLRIGLFVLWFYLVLGNFDLQEIVLNAAGNALVARGSVGDLELSLGDVAAFAVTIWLAFAISRFVRFVLEEEVLPRASLPRGVPFAVSTSARYVILLFGFLMAVAAAGIDMGRFALLIGALGVGIGIGLQDVVNNFVSGLILLFERPIQSGDTVEVSNLLGEVRRIGIRSSTIRTFDGAEVIVPNSKFVSQEFVNWTLSDKNRRIILPIGVAYGSDPEFVIRLLLEVVRSNDAILDEPEPTVLFTGFGDSSLDFEMRAWTGQSWQWRQIMSDLAIAVNRALAEANITIPFPQRDLHLRSVDPDLRKAGGGEES
ncbi:MAG: mechanosensitive ion channel domain-containing protein [Myxococcota bacterium]